MLSQKLQTIQNRIFQKRKTFAILLPLILTVVLLYPLKTYAIAPLIAYGLIVVATPVIVGAVTALFTTLTFLGIVTGLQLISLLLGSVILKIGVSVLDWGIRGGPFAYWSMTNPANNPIIQIGWTLLRDLTNMFFILGLAYIGLATALNFASFNTKKTFTTLIIIALLINFTPVICGLIVDGTNIIMNFFLSEVNFNSLADEYTNISQNIEVPNRETLAQPTWLVKTIMTQLYSTITGFVLLTFGFLLLLRHFIIWILVILSPLAFFLRIFDFSKKWFSTWWGHFVSWAWIGIPAAFFLYLGNHLMVLAKAGQISGSTADLDWTQGFWTKLTPYLIVTMFAVIALISTLKIKAAGSGIILGLANKTAKAPGTISKKVGATTGAAAGALAGAAAGGALAAAGLRGAAKKQARSLSTEEGQQWAKDHKIRGAFAKANRYVFGKRDEYTNEELAEGKDKTIGRRIVRGALTPLTAGMPLWGRGVGYQATAALRKQQEEYGKRGSLKSKSLEEKRAFKKRIGLLKSSAEQIQGTLDILEDGDAGDVWNFDNQADLDQLRGILQQAVRTSPEKAKKLRLIDFMDQWKDKKDDNGNIVYEKDDNGKDKVDSHGNKIAVQEFVRNSLLKDVYEANKDKLTVDYLDRAGLKLSENDQAFFGHGKNKEGRVINEGIHYGLGETDDNYEILIRKLIGSLKTNDVTLMSKNAQLAMLASDNFQILGNQAQIGKVAENFAREAVDVMNKTIEERESAYPGFYQKFNPKFHKYFQSTPASALGIIYSTGQLKRGVNESETLINNLNDKIRDLDGQIDDLKNDLQYRPKIFRSPEESDEWVQKDQEIEGLKNQRETMKKEKEELEKEIVKEEKISDETKKHKSNMEETLRKRREEAQKEKDSKKEGSSGQYKGRRNDNTSSQY